VNFDWVQSPDQTQISLSGPTGQTVATILINAQGAQLTEAGKPPRFASDINQLSTDVLGWPLPVAGLRDWLQGFLNAEHNTLITKATSAGAFNVDGWQMRYVSWDSSADLERPKRLDLSRQTEQVGLVSLRIVVDQWVTP
jgi:outer membrane lipoprotein LolB